MAFLAWLAGAAAMPSGAMAAAAPARICDHGATTSVTVASVNIHLEITTADGRLLRLRGLEAPRGTKTNNAIPEIARAILAEQVTGRSLTAAIAKQSPDRWGRIPASLFLPATAAHPPRRAAADLVGSGWARVDPGSDTAACLADLYGLEEKARQARSGIWSDPGYAVLDGNRRESFQAEHAGRVAIVEGKVASVARWRSLTFVNFGPGRQDFAIVIPRFARRAFDKTGGQVEKLKGQRVRVRGLLSLARGPRIEIDGPGPLELLPGEPPESGTTINGK